MPETIIRLLGVFSFDCRSRMSREKCLLDDCAHAIQAVLMRLSVIVVNWDLRDELAACLDSLRLQTHKDLEVIVVDNGSVDGSVELVRSKYPECKHLRETENLGFAEGCNRGIAIATGEWVAMLNNDAVADPSWAAELVLAAESGPPRLGMLQSLMLFKERPDVINSTGIELLSNGSGRDRQEGMPRPSTHKQEEIFCCCAGAAAYRRAMLEQVKLSSGYFDRGHFTYYEDLDLGWRARLCGWSADYVAGSVVFHRWHGSSRRHGRAWLIAIAGANRIRTLLKNASWSLLLKTSPNILGASLEVLWFGRLRGPIALYRALTSGLVTRRAVTALATEDRHSVEAKWLTPR